ncbi:MAG: ThiF family adenylyltransferase [Limisphaerales bacterium]
MNYIIGCGGVGSAITPSFCLLKSPKEITLVDGDKIEAKNLNRQMFDRSQIGMNKAEALAKKFGCAFLPDWFARGTLRLTRSDWLVVLVDNHAARKDALEVCDEVGCQAVFAANEMHSSEAFYYQRNWKGSARDPRVYYPEIATDVTGDPRAAAIGCTGEAQETNRQLVSANLMAAALAEHLFVLWQMKAPKLDKDALKRLPYKFVANMSKLENYN